MEHAACHTLLPGRFEACDRVQCPTIPGSNGMSVEMTLSRTGRKSSRCSQILKHFIRKDQTYRTRWVMTLLFVCQLLIIIQPFTQGFRGILILCLQCLLRWVRFSMGLTPSLSGVSTWNCWLAEVIEVPKDQIARMQTLLMIYNEWSWLCILEVTCWSTSAHKVHTSAPIVCKHTTII